MDQPLDRAKVQELLDLTSGDPQWIADLLQTYVDDTSLRLAELDRLARAGQLERVQREAHGVKGSSSNIGASRMAALCHETEQLARSGDVDGTRLQIPRLLQEFERIRQDIPRVVGRA